MAEASIPEGLTADYANENVRGAIRNLQSAPDHDRLAEFLAALRTGYLVVDVTGTAKKKSTRVRTIRSTTGQLLLPIFTSMTELRVALPKRQREHAKGAILPSLEALQLITSGAFVAAQFNPGTEALVVLRKYLQLVLDDAPIGADALAHLA